MYKVVKFRRTFLRYKMHKLINCKKYFFRFNKKFWNFFMVLKKSIKTNHFQITKLFRQTHEMWQIWKILIKRFLIKIKLSSRTEMISFLVFLWTVKINADLSLDLGFGLKYQNHFNQSIKFSARENFGSWRWIIFTRNLIWSTVVCRIGSFSIIFGYFRSKIGYFSI